MSALLLALALAGQLGNSNLVFQCGSMGMVPNFATGNCQSNQPPPQQAPVQYWRDRHVETHVIIIHERGQDAVDDQDWPTDQLGFDDDDAEE